MALFEDVFNKKSIYESLFLNVKSVLIHPSLNELKNNNIQLYERWKYLADNMGMINVNCNKIDVQYDNDVYVKYAPNYPEFSKIIAITYASVYMDDGRLKRSINRLASFEEYDVIIQFIDLLRQLENSESKTFPILCGYNIINHDIPLLIKRFLMYRNLTDNKEIPMILKKSLSIKPWESGVIDVANVWKFNGFGGNNSLMLIADHLGLKKTVDLLPNDKLSDYYWNNITNNPNETMEFIQLQSATQINLVIQLMNELRQV